MTQEQILQKAIEKAVGNGFNKFNFSDDDNWKYHIEKGCILIVYGTPQAGVGFINLEKIIFSIPFAKAFWNENDYGWSEEKIKEAKRMYPKARIAEWGSLDSDYSWQYHLQQMVLEEDPIKFLEKFL